MIKALVVAFALSQSPLAPPQPPLPPALRGMMVPAPSAPAAQPVASPVPVPTDSGGIDIIGVAKAIHDLAMNKDWGKLLFGVVTLLVWALRKFLGNQIPFLQSKLGGITLSFAVAFTGMLATEWPAGTHPSMQALLKALEFGFLGIGGWSFLKNMLEHLALGKSKLAAVATKILVLLGEVELPKQDPLANDSSASPTPPAK